MSVPVLPSKALIQSIVDEHFWYVGAKAPDQDFIFEQSGQKLLMTRTHAFVDRGVPCVEFRPAEQHLDWRDRVYIRFYKS